MKFRTEIEPLRDTGIKIDHNTQIVMVGSCFTDEIGGHLRSGMFDATVNPFGPLYNPQSIADEIEACIDGRGFTRDDLFLENGTYRTFRRHSRFSHPDAGVLVDRLNADLAATRAKLAQAELLIATFGSTIGFRRIADQEIVANCHKRPSSEFEQEIFHTETNIYRWRHLASKLRKLNPGLKIILTVSPVRHIGYGLVADRRSKSSLCLACAQLEESMADTLYFPSYEIMVDDLRDYRFYADDFVHPSAAAVEYIYDIFQRSFMEPATIAKAAQWQKLTRRLGHRSDNPQFLADFRAETAALAEKLAGHDKPLLQRFISLSEEYTNRQK